MRAIMYRSVLVLSAAIVLCGFSSLLRAQTETVIDARDRDPVTTGTASWTASLNPDTTLKAALAVADPNLRAGSRVDYDLVITNTGRKAVAIPRTLDWKEIGSNSSGRRYVRGTVEFQLSAENMTTIIPILLNVYSVDEKPATALVLRPGDTIRFLGNIVLPKMAFGPKWRGDAMLVAHFCESSVSMTRFAEESLWCVSSGEKFEVNYAPEQ
jgi:hypothetical protein